MKNMNTLKDFFLFKRSKLLFSKWGGRGGQNPSSC